jgi:asparagine synthase (glutamine-hydrolysing)
LCGIAGFTHRHSAAHPGRIQSAAASLLHRGPDQQGVFESSAVSLCATRLKIIDLTGGDQPIAAGGSVIVFNGEIYNHLEIRRELEQRGHRFQTHSDTETVLHAFLEWDTDCFARLRGMFAVALWTEASERLVLARDRIGIKPLYIARRGENLYFGSEMKALFVHPEIDRQLSLAGLDGYLSLNYVPGIWTLIEGVEKLPPGHWFEWRGGKVRRECYWSLPDPASHRTLLTDPRAAQDQLDFLLRQSVKEHLLSDVPLSVWLSGGVDSSTLLYYAAENCSSSLQTFSISFQGRSFDESGYIRLMTERFGTKHHQLDMSDEGDLPGTIEDLAYYSDEPNADAGAVPVWLLSKLTKQSATVALSGEGADELFGGYLTHRADMLARTARKLPGGVLNLAGLVARRLPVSDEKIGLEYKLNRFLDGCRMRPERAHVYWNGTFSDSERRALLQPTAPGALNTILADLAQAGDNLPAYLWFDQKYYLPDDILTKVDRISMAHSLEVRPPFVDHRIVEFAATLPPSMRIQGSRQKVILKDLMRDKLPPAILTRKKIGFDIPAHQWLRGELRPMLLDAVSFAGREHSGLFRMDSIDAHVNSHLDRRQNLGYHLWGLMTLFLWMRKWRIQTTPLVEAVRSTETILTSI